MKKRVYVLGNPVVGNDSTPVKILPFLEREFPEIEFIHVDPTEEFPIGFTRDIILIDTVIGIKEVTSFSDLDLWARSPRVSVHDFDLPVSLGLLKKLGKIESVKIIGVPERGSRKKITNQIVRLLNAI